MKLNHKILIGFVASSVILISVTFLSYKNNESFIASNKLVNYTYEVISEFDQILTAVVDMETGARGFVITGDEAYLEPYHTGRKALFEHYNNVKNLVTDNNIKRKVLEMEGPLNDALLFRENLVDVRRSNNDSALKIVLSGKGKQTQDKVRSLIAECKKLEYNFLFQRSRENEEDARSFNFIFILLSSVISLVLIGVYIIIHTNLKALRKADLEIKNKNWLLTGATEVNDKLKGEKTIIELGDSILTSIIPYLNSQIGAFYVCDESESVLNFVSGYAISKEHHSKEVIKLGEGLIGEAAKQRKTIFISEVPSDYIRINSSIGEVSPKNIVIVPFIHNNHLMGVLEIGTINDFSDLELQFLENVCESIATALATTGNRMKIQNLLEESQAQAEELQAQQEELTKQNIKLGEIQEEINGQIKAINLSNLALEIDVNGKIAKVNDLFCKRLGYAESELLSMDYSELLEESYLSSKDYFDLWNSLKNGKNYTGEIKCISKNGNLVWLQGNYNPILDHSGKVTKILSLTTDVTIQIEQQLKIQQQLKLMNETAIYSEADLDGNITYVNEIFCEISKYSKEELLGKNHRILKSGQQPDGLFVGMWKAISKGLVWKGVICNIAKDGTYYWVDTTITPFKDIYGKIEKYVAIRFDITKQVELQESLKAQAEELKVQQEELMEVNSALEEQGQKLQASEEELKVQQEELLQSNQELEEKSQLLEERNQAVNEKNEALESASAELELKANQLALSSKYKSEFLANMSHELRTPLNSILLLSKLISENTEKNLTKEQIEFASVIYNSGNGLLELINEILDLSKIESGKMDVQLEDTNINSICTSISNMFSQLAKEKGIDYICNIEPTIRKSIKTDKIRLEQILKNLLSNAFKFTEKGGVEMHVFSPDVKSIKKLGIQSQEIIAFSVKDSGIGIPIEKQNLIFEAFQQADGSTRRKYGGTGLGLSISREIAHMLGGEITLESKENEGSTFTLIIPVNSSSSQINIGITEDQDKTGIYRKALTKEQDKNVVAFTPDEIPDDRGNLKNGDKVILIIEDDTDFAKALMKFANNRGYKAIIAVSGAFAVSFAELYKPIGILLDIQLPVKSGWTVMKELKQNPLTRHIPVHMMSSNEVKSIESIHAGAIDFINKPMAEKELRKVFEKLENIWGKKTKTILLVDDNEMHIKALKAFLDGDFKNCLSAYSAKETYEVLEAHEVDCIVLDMGLPDATGYEVLEKIKKQKKYEKLPVIIYTGKNLSLKDEQRLKKYANAVVIKTVDSYKRLMSEVTLFLHLVEEHQDSKILKKPYFKDKVLVGKKVLIVDDDSRNIFSLTKVLEMQEMVVIPATDGKDALSTLAENPDTDIILMDMMMPEMDGYVASREIRKNSKLKTIPIIAVTAKAMLGEREKCIEAGANDYITKPVDTDQLISLLRIWLYK
ncbi:MAG: response regulator [Bacteroidia bacterium]